MKNALRDRAKKILAQMDERGAWVEAGELRYQDAEDVTTDHQSPHVLPEHPSPGRVPRCRSLMRFQFRMYSRGRFSFGCEGWQHGDSRL